jgi:hypothetical protein
VKIDPEKFTARTAADADPGWFTYRAVRGADLLSLPVGDQELGGVKYHIFDFTTSPVPSVVMLAGEGSDVEAEKVTGLEVGKKADALFFLHTYNPGRNARRWDEADRRARSRLGRPEVLRYRIHYADGQEREIPVLYGTGIGPWASQDPRAMRDAALAWNAPIEGREGWKLALYSKQWNNPRPEVEIESVDVLLGEIKNVDRWGAPALVAVTAARAR